MANINVAIPRAKANQLSLEEQTRGFSHKFHVDYTDVNTGGGASDTVTLGIATLPATYVIDRCLVNVTTAFAGTTAFTLTVGSTTTVNAYLTSQSVMTAAALQGAVGATAIVQGTAAISAVAVFTNATGGSPSALTAGACDIYLNIIDLTQQNRLG